MMTSNQINEGLFGDDFMGLGFNITSEKSAAKGPRYAGAFAWGGYFNTNYWADPKEQIIMVLMKQTRNLQSDDSEALFTRMIYQSLDE